MSRGRRRPWRPWSRGLIAGIAGAVVTLGAAAADQVRFAAGPFTMGSDDARPDARPAHVVDLGGFAIDQRPVTNRQFAAFLNAVGLAAKGGQDRFDDDDTDARIHRVGGEFVADRGFADHPVVEASWFGARDYCRWRGRRLPTEAEYERAARGRKKRPYPWGDAQPNSSRAQFAAPWGETVGVATRADGATPEGLFHMTGNVHHWVSSLYKPYPYRADDGREVLEVSGERVTRGGAHDSPAHHLGTTWRGRGVSRAPERGHHNIGFRCARSLS